tara:strand:+ start:2908 stop:3390 length:483 start_codon:yes stop_codon:yes gene_type:complete
MNKFYDRIFFPEDNIINKDIIGPYMIENFKLKFDKDSTKIPLKDYYQSYPFIKINPKNILNFIYNINNIEKLLIWLKINKNKNKNTIYRVLDLSWIVFKKKMLLYIDKIKHIYIHLLTEKQNVNLKKAEILIDTIIFKNKFDFNSTIYFSTILNNFLEKK